MLRPYETGGQGRTRFVARVDYGRAPFDFAQGKKLGPPKNHL